MKVTKPLEESKEVRVELAVPELCKENDAAPCKEGETKVVGEARGVLWGVKE